MELIDEPMNRDLVFVKAILICLFTIVVIHLF